MFAFVKCIYLLRFNGNSYTETSGNKKMDYNVRQKIKALITKSLKKSRAAEITWALSYLLQKLSLMSKEQAF